MVDLLVTLAATVCLVQRKRSLRFSVFQWNKRAMHSNICPYYPGRVTAVPGQVERCGARLGIKCGFLPNLPGLRHWPLLWAL